VDGFSLHEALLHVPLAMHADVSGLQVWVGVYTTVRGGRSCVSAGTVSSEVVRMGVSMDWCEWVGLYGSVYEYGLV
jgi:hypothetical protein